MTQMIYVCHLMLTANIGKENKIKTGIRCPKNVLITALLRGS